jgi:hypothetical protein
MNLGVVGYQILTVVIFESFVFRVITHCSPLKISGFSEEHVASNFKVEGLTKQLDFMLVSCLAYSSTLKMVATCFSGTSVDFQQATGGYIPEVRILKPYGSIKKVRVF